MIAREIRIADRPYTVTCVNVGNPHCVVFHDAIDALDLSEIGPHFEYADIFPERVNTEFVRLVNPTTLRMRTWERGSGETFACGTGACAVAVAACLNGYCKQGDTITVKLRGGDLHIVWKDDGTVMMTGSATHVFDGEIDLDAMQ